MSDAQTDERLNALAERLRPLLRTPRNTYRVQLNASFTFDDLRAQAPYLDALGVDTCYLSPCLEAKPGSSHGYDVVDHGRFNPELGTAESFGALARELQQRGIGLMFDVVPNHMNLDPVHNRRWRDVLENGQSAAAAAWFDVDWQPAKEELRDKVLLPILGDQYGLVLERGELHIGLREGRFVVRYFESELPIDPSQIPLAIGPEVEELRGQAAPEDADTRELLSILTAFGNLPRHVERDPARRDERHRESQVAYERFTALLARAPTIGAIIDRAIVRLNGSADRPASFDALHELLERQPYRLAYWRTALDEINYRRFFDIIELGAVRVEDPVVFAEAHKLVLELVRDGVITAIRLDHPDGLNDPDAYFERLQAAVWRVRAEALGADTETLDALATWRITRRAEDPMHWAVRPLYLAAEKILVPGERFRPNWAIHGGVGYLFLNQVNGLFVDRAGLHQLERLWSRLPGPAEFPEIAYECRSLIARTSLASEMNMLAHALERIAAHDRRSRDFTLNSLRKVLREVVACFPVYRTYVTERGASESDRLVIARAVNEARRRSPVMEASIFDFIEEVLGGAKAPPADSDRLRFAMRFQQITGPIQAKGLEDTAFYRYCPLLAINEVGSDPASPSLGVDQFHDANRVRFADWPVSMLALATHDTKRSGDARARLTALTERPAEWRRAIANWMRLNSRHRSTIAGESAPDRADEYHFYQALLAIWPPESEHDPVPTVAPVEIETRVSAYMVKAIREAKVQSSWLRPNQTYEDAMTTFIRVVLTGAGSTRFLSRFVPFARTVARLGAANGLAQLVLQMGSPGVPDVYQGAELWHLHVVDPDNRQPVDFVHRRAILDGLLPDLERVERGDGEALPLVRELAAQWADGRVKMWVVATLLRYRRRHAELFRMGDYVPVAAEPAQAPVVAFARSRNGEAVLAITARHASRLSKEWPVGPAWTDATVLVPQTLEGRSWRDALTGRVVGVTRGADGQERIALADALDPLPIAWLSSGAG
jgi:(1->4)-alpha-D-glucan 1-alpha-D-glucosylmutase